MARPLRIKKNADAHYHLMSRTNNKRFLFRDGTMKTELVSALRRAAEFCGVHINAYTAMDNHFHVIVKVTKPDEPVDANAVSGDWCLRHIVQIGAGKVFRDAHFVMATAYALGDRFKAGSVGAHRVEEVGWSTHGWRLATAKGRKSDRNERVSV